MNKYFILLVLLIFITSCTSSNNPKLPNLDTSNINENQQGGLKMEVISNNFKNNQDMSSKYTCQGLDIPPSSIEVKNDFGKKQYGGPCPPSGKHRYFFRIYALKTQKLESINEVNFLEKVNENNLDTAEIIGLYQKK